MAARTGFVNALSRLTSVYIAPEASSNFNPYHLRTPGRRPIGGMECGLRLKVLMKRAESMASTKAYQGNPSHARGIELPARDGVDVIFFGRDPTSLTGSAGAHGLCVSCCTSIAVGVTAA